MKNLILYLFSTMTLIKLSTQTTDPASSHLFPPGAVEEFNVTGSLNSFVEQIQANSRSQEIQNGAPIVQMPPLTQGRASSLIYYNAVDPMNPNVNTVNPIVNHVNPQPQIVNPPVVNFQVNPNSFHQPQSAPAAIIQGQPPVIMGPQNRPALDPALQQLLNSLNTNPAEAQRNTFVQGQQMMQADLNTPIVSYITCYVGCSHVTNIVTNSATVAFITPWRVLFLALTTTLILMF